IGEARCGGGQAPRSNHYSTMSSKIQNLFVSLRGEPIDAGKDKYLIRNSNAFDRIGIDEIEIEAGIKHLRYNLRPEEALHGLVDSDVGAGFIEPKGRSRRLVPLPVRAERSPHIIVRQEERNIIRGLALAQGIADSLKVACKVRHRWKPWIVCVERSSRIHAPARITRSCGGVRPTMADKLIDPLQEVQIRFSFHIKWRGSERRTMQPCPHF